MNKFVIYNQTTGQILRCVSCSPDMIDVQCREDQTWIEGEQVDDNEVYVVDGAIAERPSFVVVVDGSVISGVPAGTTVTIEEAEYTADGEDIEFEPTIPGTYSIGLALFPYQTTTIQVTA